MRPSDFFKPFGNPRGSMTGAKAIAPPSQEFEPKPFNGIGSLPNAPLQGGAGEVWGGGRKQMDTQWKQPKAGYRGEFDDPLAVNYGDLYKTFANKKDAPTPDEFSRRVAGPRVESLDELQPGVRGLYGRMQANLASQIGIDPLSEEYAQILLGKRPDAFSLIRGNDPLSGVNLGMVGGTGALLSQPPTAQPVMSPAALPPDGPMVPGEGGYGGSDFMPISNNGGFDGGLPSDLPNPFDAPENLPRPSLSRADIPADPMEAMGAMPPAQLQQPMPMMQPNGFLSSGPGYDMLKEQFGRGIDSKRERDRMRGEQWRRDMSQQGFGDFMTGVNNIFSGFAGKDRGAQRFLDGQTQNYMTQSQNSRRMRGSEMGQQFDEDKYYSQLLNENDPGSPENAARMQNAYNGMLNAQAAMENARSRGELNAARAEFERQRDELMREKEKGLMERARMENTISEQANRIKGFDAETKRTAAEAKAKNDSGRLVETTRSNKAKEGLTARGQDLQRKTAVENESGRNSRNAANLGQKERELNLKAGSLSKDGMPKYDEATRRGGARTLDPKVPEQRQILVDFLRRAGGDKQKAMELARQAGYLL